MRNRNTNRATTKLSQRQRLLIAGAVSTLLIVLIVLVYQSFQTTTAKAAVSGDYRSKVSGNWSTAGTWETYNGSAWVNAVSAPSSANNVINIQNGHTVTLTSNVTADQLTIDAGGILVINSTRTLTINNGTGTDFTINGTLNNSGTLSQNGALVNNGTLLNSSTITLNAGASMTNGAGSFYQHAQNGGTIPSATWNATSTCNITGVTGTMPTNINQNYGNLTWNCTGQTATFAFNSNLSIQGDFNLISTSANRLALTDGFTSRTFTVGGNYVQSGGEFRLTDGWSGGTLNTTGSLSISAGTLLGNNSNGTSTFSIGGNLNISGSATLIQVSSGFNSTMTISGDVSITGGTLRMSESSGNATLNVAGHFTHTGGTISETGSGTGAIVFNGSVQQNYTSGGTITGAINHTVNNNAYLQMSTPTTAITGGGTFTLTNGGKLGITSPNGITSSGATGNIQGTGTRTFNTGADYTYNGTATQATGNGLPSTVRNLTFNNSNGFTLTGSTSASGTMTFTAGNVTTNANILTLGTSSSTLGTLSRSSGQVIGNFRRWLANATVSNLEFPVGTSSFYNGVLLSYTAAPAAGHVTVSFNNGFPGVYGLPISDAGDECTTIGSGWWTLSAGGGLSGGTFTIAATAEGFTGITDYTSLHLFHRTDNTNVWTASGTHAAPTGSIAIPIINRTGLTQMGEFGITSTAANPLPVKLISFEVKENNGAASITWSTASERNSDYFVVERSQNGQKFTDLKRVDAAGNSTSIKNYAVVDPSPLPGVSYYRLRQVDINGKFENFGPKAFNNSNSKQSSAALKSFTVSPNPFRTDLTLHFESIISGTMPMQIFTQQGTRVYSGNIDVSEGSNNNSFPLADQLKAGTYIISIGEGSSKITTTVVKL